MIASFGIFACTIAFIQSKPKQATGPYIEYDPPEAPPHWVDQVTQQTKKERPNILFVVYDARRRDDFSFGPHANTRNDTPFLSEFKDHAAYFQNAVSPGCWTVPVHASIFSGLSVRDLGIDLYQPGYNVYPKTFLSLPEILRLTGYRTIAYADHPYFLGNDMNTSLIRGFKYYSIIRDFRRGFATRTNVASRGNHAEKQYPLQGIKNLPYQSVLADIASFNAGDLRFDLETQADYDPTTGLYFPHLYSLYQQSEYFQRRYGDDFDRKLFAKTDDDPYFLFVNLHMCLIAEPDPGLWSTWAIKTLLMNAQAQQTTVESSAQDLTIENLLDRNIDRLGFTKLSSSELGMKKKRTLVKEVFDNRFYDCNFRAIWEYLDQMALTENTVTIVASDHGMGHSERGAKYHAHGGARPHETIVQVPLIIRFPKSSTLERLHQTYEQTVSLTDLFQTIVELGIGSELLSRPIPIRGKSLVHRMIEGDFESMVFSECTLKPDSYDTFPQQAGYARAIYADNMKMIHAPETSTIPSDLEFFDRIPHDPTTRTTLTELYDLANDPNETTNLALSNHPALAKMFNLFQTILVEAVRDDHPDTPEWNLAETDTLRALGYVE